MTKSPEPLPSTLVTKIKDFVRAEIYPLEHAFLRRPFRELAPELNAKENSSKPAECGLPIFQSNTGVWD